MPPGDRRADLVTLLLARPPQATPALPDVLLPLVRVELEPKPWWLYDVRDIARFVGWFGLHHRGWDWRTTGEAVRARCVLRTRRHGPDVTTRQVIGSSSVTTPARLNTTDRVRVDEPNPTVRTATTRDAPSPRCWSRCRANPNNVVHIPRE